MKTNLSSQIKLDRIPKRYYAPDGELELAALTRDEKVYTKIFEGSEEGSVYVAHDVAELIQKCKAEHRGFECFASIVIVCSLWVRVSVLTPFMPNWYACIRPAKSVSRMS